MKFIYILNHSYIVDDIEETKFLGAYSSKEKAQNAIKRFILLPGFKDRPNDFHLDEHEIDQDQWQEGFLTIENIYTKDIDGNWIIVTSEALGNGYFKIVEKNKNDRLGLFKAGDIVKCEIKNNNFYAISKTD
ncbi:DUF7336 domain-containing protein [Leptospira kanakyensis]|uniref:DUF7336 domain-containing protein n=1 Tax=Leptospira kanakyensis TaxID=2484968 RepID=UPI001AEFFE4A|nr:hypothetical protein [Leptospira kanakyensis]MCW7471695.1 hypothetical protein [Leptospira kanakyensis]MCW7483325.1 hypothetical protein [Leptospira kanakyensis]